MLDWLERNRTNVAAVLVVLVAVAGVTLLQIPRRSALQVLSPAGPGVPPAIKVHVLGEVALPGVYALAADARVEDALKAAGGAAGAADVGALNLAMPLRDGQQVVVPKLREVRAAAAPTAGVSTAGAAPPVATAVPRLAARATATPRTGKLDLNVASQREMEDLPGIGTVTARRILDYRTKNGPFTSIDELRETKLVNASTFEKIKDLVEAR